MSVRRSVTERLLSISLLLSCVFAQACSTGTTPTDPIEPLPPTSGSLELTIEESGPRPDTDGYEVSITLAIQAGPVVRTLPQGGGAFLFPDLPLGPYVLRVEGLASHCFVTGTHPRAFRIRAGMVSHVALGIFCPGPGALLVKTVTRGRDFGTGYSVSIQGESAQDRSLGLNDSLLIGELDLPAGARWLVRLHGIPDNCWVERPLMEVRPFRGETFRLEYSVGCIPSSSRFAFEHAGTIYVTNGSQAFSIGGFPFARLRGLSLSPDRTRVVFSSGGDFNDDPALLLGNADGSGVGWLTTDGAVASVGPQAWSPDGSRIVFWKAEGGLLDLGDIYVMNVNGSGVVRLTHDGLNTSPAWSPDGSSIAFCKSQVFDFNDVYFGVYRMSAVDGSGVTALVERGCDPAWSPDGSRIAFTDSSLFRPLPDLAVVRSDGSGLVRLHPSGVTSQQQASRSPIWSPDGSQIAYTGGTSVQRIWIVDFEGSAFGEAFPYHFGTAPSWR